MKTIAIYYKKFGNKVLPALGSDSVFRPDGRKTLEHQADEAADHSRKHGFVAFDLLATGDPRDINTAKKLYRCRMKEEG